LKNPLFSRYRQGENRVTASMLAVFERIDSSLLQEMLSRAIGDDLPLVSFVNQVSGDESVPDASISGDFAYFFEVKTERSAVGRTQIEKHLRHLAGKVTHERLFVVTPDPGMPEVVRTIRNKDPRLTWFNFAALDGAIESVLSEPYSTVPELQRYLLRELQALFDSEGLIVEADVVVVPAADAYGVYLNTGAYVCQPDRTFRAGIDRIAFYARGEIQPEVPMILHRDLTYSFEDKDALVQRLLSTIDHEYEFTNKAPVQRAEALLALIEADLVHEDEAFQFFVLSRARDERTIVLQHAIKNTTISENGRPMAWARNQRYVPLRALQSGVTTTSALDALVQEENRRISI
jgi:hypothetical protein